MTVLIAQLQRPSFPNWSEAEKYLAALDKEYGEKFQTLTPFEAEAFASHIREEKQRLRPQIDEGLADDLRYFMREFKKAESAHEAARQKDFQRFDGQALAAEMKVYEGQLQREAKRGGARAVKAHYQKVKSEGSELQRRAAAEVVANFVPDGFPEDDKLQINRLSVAAARDAERLTYTEETLKAQGQESEAARILKNAYGASVGRAQGHGGLPLTEDLLKKISVTSSWEKDPQHPERVFGWEVRCEDV